MSQFGYQQNYQSKTQGTPQYAPYDPMAGQAGPSHGGNQATQLPNPTIPFAPMVSSPNPYGAINFNPEVTEAWKNPGQSVVGWRTGKKQGGPGDFTNTQGDYRSPLYRMDPWRNPVAEYFGNIAGPIKGIAMDPNALPGSNPFADASRPQNSMQLYNTIGSLTAEQLQKLSGQYPGMVDNFRLAAQDYANAFANPLYARGAKQGLTGGMGRTNERWDTLPVSSGTPFSSQQQNADWLQASANLLTNRLNDSYLL